MCTEEALKALFALPAARPQRVLGEINAVSLQNGVPICGRERVYQAIRQLLRESTDSADLLLHVEQQEFCRILGEESLGEGCGLPLPPAAVSARGANGGEECGLVWNAGAGAFVRQDRGAL